MQNIENTIKNSIETNEIECQILLFEPGTSRIAGRKKTIYAHIAGRYNRVLIIVFVYTAATPKPSLNQILLIMAELQKKMQNSDE